jgi:hypothetical protein
MAFDFIDRVYATGAQAAKDAQDEIDAIINGVEADPEVPGSGRKKGNMSDPLTMLAVDKAGMGMTTAITAVATMMKTLKDSAEQTAGKF